MVDTKLIGQEVINKRGERGIINKIEDYIYVNYEDRECMYALDAFDEGFLQFVDIKLNRKCKLDKYNRDSKVLDEELKTYTKEINNLIGLSEIKSKIDELVCQTKITNLRKAMGLKVPETTNHMVFMGNPGTGKTTVARIIAKIFKALGTLSSGHLVEVDRSQLVAAYQGQTALKTTKVLKSALGGVLFIDEAYSLCRGDNDDYGYEALDTITKFMEDHRDDLIIIAAGYGEEMIDFIKSNPGLSSRFKTFITFEDYSGEELFDIFDNFFTGCDYQLSDEAKDDAIKFFNKERTCPSNAREVRNMFERTINKQSKRLSAYEHISKSDLMTIAKDDLCLNVWAKAFN